MRVIVDDQNERTLHGPSIALFKPPRVWPFGRMLHVPSRAEVLAAIRGLGGHSVAVVGDPVLDVYVLGTTHRISREAPVLIVREDNREYRLGGAANTAANFAALGAHVRLVGGIGHDDEGRTLVKEVQALDIDTQYLVRQGTSCTTTKTRVLGGGLHTTKQQMLRIDRENTKPPAAEDREALLSRATEALDGVSALIISDYGAPENTDLYVELSRRAKQRGVRVVVDSRYALRRFSGVDVITPNEPEVEEALGVTLQEPEAALDAAQRLVQDLGLQAAVITRGREGMAIATADGGRTLLRAHGGHEAVDVTGAGDTVTATFTLAWCGGASVVSAASLANCAASLVVQQIGVASCTPGELKAVAQEDLQ